MPYVSIQQNDNDFIGTMMPPVGNGDNPNQFFVFAFGDDDLPLFESQRFHDDDRNGDRGERERHP